MKIHHISEQNSVLNHFLAEIRDTNIQKDRMRFRRNIERIGEIMSYEISKTFHYENIEVKTPLGIKHTTKLVNSIVLCSILRAGLALHQGFMNYFDEAENGFISAYRHHYNHDDHFEILVEYQATPSFEGKSLILIDPMLATGQSIVAVLNKLYSEHQPKEIHIAVVIAAPEGIEYLEKNLPKNTHLWIASIDEKLNEKNYIVPGLGDAGDLAYGEKL
ncbi:uracil phosphoribosyltransferase [Flavobacterium columnare NBRC 100251 = ATCC 23463]|uniref:Uracil phosphoribosyltransferase n=1 Tax=Flavobacterium columnare (strain ATCC 49512 / CIP 103533 / TG 44/87) TaxID=1041826 RepID=G8X8K6_FLACA|nr:uracil phosphoribosyltransferase [Flavobacterium columnare]AEW86457.1 uracil phosphoribosyltransferase [Flavobacterium columnare ATCC 49512]ANO49639.1 uracil phosphoribosyltransferase [Flavobacterium columnare]APT22424.1 uracil phosphoribosyltransferase [Flavobacterium columnare]OOB83377.1 uracil phosphoribosyltransferase [Flavobacterium columnare]PDS26999.1 uracil phosphoribosyltransferase [Flavobacterium columnare NBRC 100251 = ATCC 23463]